MWWMAARLSIMVPQIELSEERQLDEAKGFDRRAAIGRWHGDEHYKVTRCRR